MSIPELIKQLHSLVSMYVRKRDKQCVICGTKEGLEAGHLIKRGKKSTTFDLKNVNAQCRICNNIHNTNPEIYEKWYIRKYGLEDYEKLVQLGNTLKQWRRTELIQKINEMQERIKDLTILVK